MHCPLFPEHRNTADALHPTLSRSARAPRPHFAKGDALSVLSPSLMITHVCWIWAGEKTRCRLDHLRVNCSNNRCSNVFNLLRAPSVVSREQNKVAVYFKAECLVFVSSCASGNLGNKGRTCVSWKKVHLQALLSLRWKPSPSSEIWWMLARKYMELIVSQGCGATLSRFQINIDQALLPDRRKHCQLPELWWKERHWNRDISEGASY